MGETAAMNGAEWLAQALAGTGLSHVFFVESTLRRTLLHLRELGVRRKHTTREPEPTRKRDKVQESTAVGDPLA